MRAKIITVVILAASGLMPAAFGVSPASSAPSVPNATTVPETGGAAPAVNPTSSARANQVVYTHRLPTVQELTEAASAKGSTITRVEQTDSEILATYRFGSGQEGVVAYRLLPAAGSTAPGSAPVVTSAAPSVVYVPSSRVVYYNSYPYSYPYYYNPWYWYPYPYSTVGFGIGFGYHYGHHHHGYRHWGHHGGYHGGYRHGGHYRSGYAHGGHHRHR